MFTESVSVSCIALFASGVRPFLFICLSRVYAFCSVFCPVGVVSPCLFIMMPKWCICGSVDMFASCSCIVLSVCLCVNCVFMFACTGYMCWYDHAMLLNCVLGVFGGMFVMVTKHFAAFRPSLVTRENAPPASIYHCIFCLISCNVVAVVYLELSSQYDSMCMLGVCVLFVLCECI